MNSQQFDDEYDLRRSIRLHKSIEDERASIIEVLELHKVDYLIYRGSSFSQITGELLWAKDDAMAYAEGIDSAIALIKARSNKATS